MYVQAFKFDFQTVGYLIPCYMYMQLCTMNALEFSQILSSLISCEVGPEIILRIISHPSDNGQQKYTMSWMRPWESKAYDKRPKFSQGLPIVGQLKPVTYVAAHFLKFRWNGWSCVNFVRWEWTERCLLPWLLHLSVWPVFNCSSTVTVTVAHVQTSYRVSPNYSSFSDHF